MTSGSASVLELVELLHTAARRYCQERDREWMGQYNKLQKTGQAHITRADGSWFYTKNARGIYPRYNVLEAILIEIETVTPEQLGEMEAARRMLGSLVESAESLMTSGDNDAVEKNAMAEERALLLLHLDALTEADLYEVRSLPYRRTLSATEIEEAWRRLEQRWGVEGGWVPIAGSEDASHLVMDAHALAQSVTPQAPRRALHRLGVRRVFELREHEGSRSVEIDLELLDPYYDGAEGYWYPDKAEWLLYASHENSMTAAGDEIIAVIEDVWPTCREHPWSL